MTAQPGRRLPPATDRTTPPAWRVGLLLATSPVARVRITHTLTGPRVLSPAQQRTGPGQPVVLDLTAGLVVGPPLAALAREITRQAPLVILAGDAAPAVRDWLAGQLADHRPGLCFTLPLAVDGP